MRWRVGLLYECRPDFIQCQSTVQIAVARCLLNPNGFQHSSSNVARTQLLQQLGRWSMSHACTAIPFFLSMVFTAYLCSLNLFYVCCITILTWNPVDNLFLLQFSSSVQMFLFSDVLVFRCSCFQLLMKVKTRTSEVKRKRLSTEHPPLLWPNFWYRVKV